MEPYNPTSRLSDELDTNIAIDALRLCLRFFAAGNVSEFAALIDEIRSRFEQQPRPIDPLDHLYRMLLAESKARLSILDAVEQWHQAEEGQGQAVSIEPLRWTVTVRTREHPREYTEVDAEWDRRVDVDDAVVRIFIFPTDGDGPVAFNADWRRFARYWRAVEDEGRIS